MLALTALPPMAVHAKVVESSSSAQKVLFFLTFKQEAEARESAERRSTSATRTVFVPAMVGAYEQTDGAPSSCDFSSLRLRG